MPGSMTSCTCAPGRCSCGVVLWCVCFTYWRSRCFREENLAILSSLGALEPDTTPVSSSCKCLVSNL